MIGDESTHLSTSTLDLLSLELRFFGAAVANKLDDQVSHVLVDER